MTLFSRFFKKNNDAHTAENFKNEETVIANRRWKIESILAPLVRQRIIDSHETLSTIIEILLKLDDPELKQDAITWIAGILNKLSNNSRQEFFLAISGALWAAYGVDVATTTLDEIVKVNSDLDEKKNLLKR